MRSLSSQTDMPLQIALDQLQIATDVTNAQFRKFVTATGYKTSRLWRRPSCWRASSPSTPVDAMIATE
jgi:hypothetical protein